MASTALQPVPNGTKSLQATEQLADMVRALGSGARLPTIRELCKQMQISRPTLESALDRLELQGWLYRKQRSGIYISSLAQTRRIGLIARRELLEGRAISGNSYQLLLEALRNQCRQNNCLLTSYVHDPQHDRDKCGPEPLELDVQHGRIDGLVVCGLDGKETNQVQSLGVPCVYYSHGKEYAPRVTTSMELLVSDGVQALASKGCRKIGLAYWMRPDKKAARNCLEIFQKNVRAAGLDVDFQWLMPFVDGESTNFRSLEASRLFYNMWTSKSQRPDGLLSIDDQYTSGVLHAMELLGVRSPDDMLVASFVNKGSKLFGGIEVIRLEYDPDEKARLLMEALDDLLNDKPMVEERILPHRIHWPEYPSNKSAYIETGTSKSAIDLK